MQQSGSEVPRAPLKPVTAPSEEGLPGAGGRCGSAGSPWPPARLTAHRGTWGNPGHRSPGAEQGRQAHGRLRNTWGNEAGWDFLGKSGRVRVVGEAGAQPFPVQDLPAEEPLDGGRKEVVKTGPWGRFGQGSFPLTPTPLPGLGETSDKPDPACHLGSSQLPSGGLSGGLGHGQKEGRSRCGSPGALQAKPGEVLRARRGCRGPGGPWGGELGGRAPSPAAIAREAAPLCPHRLRGSPRPQPSVPSRVSWPLDFSSENVGVLQGGAQAGKEVTHGGLAQC